MSTPSLCKPLAATALILFGLGALAPDEMAWKASDHKKLGKDIAGWFEAKDESKGIDKAYLDITENVAKLEKKLDGADALSMVEDWEEAFYHARLETLGKGIKSRKGKVAEATAELPGGVEAELAIFVPSSYNARKGPYPLVLVVPDEGQAPQAVLEEHWSDDGLQGEAILLAPRMPADVAVWNEITSDSGPGGIATIMSLYGQMLRAYPIDMDRVYLAGHGAGAAAAGRAAALYPQLFAGLVAIEGSAGFDAVNFQNLPTLALGPGEGCDALAAAVEELGYANCTRMDEGGAGEIWAWCADKERDPYPESITFVPQTPYTTSAHWLSLEGVDVAAGPRVQARLDRANNAIVIDAEKVTTVQVFFNDRLVDMDKAVNIIINGVSHEGSVARNKRLMLELNYSLGDWGRVFTNRLPYDVPLEQAK